MWGETQLNVSFILGSHRRMFGYALFASTPLSLKQKETVVKQLRRWGLMVHRKHILESNIKPSGWSSCSLGFCQKILCPDKGYRSTRDRESLKEVVVGSPSLPYYQKEVILFPPSQGPSLKNPPSLLLRNLAPMLASHSGFPGPRVETSFPLTNLFAFLKICIWDKRH